MYICLQQTHKVFVKLVNLQKIADAHMQTYTTLFNSHSPKYTYIHMCIVHGHVTYVVNFVREIHHLRLSCCC